MTCGQFHVAGNPLKVFQEGIVLCCLTTIVILSCLRILSLVLLFLLLNCNVPCNKTLNFLIRVVVLFWEFPYHQEHSQVVAFYYSLELPVPCFRATVCSWEVMGLQRANAPEIEKIVVREHCTGAGLLPP